jgi:hypothetical protein
MEAKHVSDLREQLAVNKQRLYTNLDKLQNLTKDNPAHAFLYGGMRAYIDRGIGNSAPKEK